MRARVFILTLFVLATGAVSSANVDDLELSEICQQARTNALMQKTFARSEFGTAGHVNDLTSSDSRLAVEANISELTKNISELINISRVDFSNEKHLDNTFSKSAQAQFDVNQMWGTPQLSAICIMLCLPLIVGCAVYALYQLLSALESDGQDDGRLDRRPRLVSDSSGSVPIFDSPSHGSAAPGPIATFPGLASIGPLCQELTAPPRKECFVGLPSLLGLDVESSACERKITSKTGMGIVQVILTRLPKLQGCGVGETCGTPGEILERISLVATKDRKELGYCELQVLPFVGDECSFTCCIFRSTGEFLASLERQHSEPTSEDQPSVISPAYILKTKTATPSCFRIQGDVERRKMEVIDNSKGEKVMFVEPGHTLDFYCEDSDYYRLQVQPKADAGVAILALMAIDRLPASSSS